MITPDGVDTPSVSLDFRILGPLEVRAEGRSLPLGGPRQRTILAQLLLAADRVVSFERLIEQVWQDRPPNSSRTQVAICVAALRKAFRDAGCPDEVIVTNAPGYLLTTAGHRLDVVDFDERSRRAEEAAQSGRTAEAAAMLRGALGLWRGRVLTGINAHEVEIEAARLAERRLSAVELWAELQLQLGQHQELAGALSGLVHEHPLRDKLRAHLMLAQYGSGRRAEALDTFRKGRQYSIEELGLEPSPALQQLHAAILRDDPGLVAARPSGSSARRGAPPAQLPARVSAFTGRQHEVAALDRMLERRSGADPVAVGFLTGGPGIGKTCLAVHWAHRVANQFPDGQLFADLRGYDPHHDPELPGTTLHRFLRALGVPAERIPNDVSEQAALYRSTLDGRRVLVILDNARSPEQIAPLLPGNGLCTVVVTARTQLTDLMDSHCALRLRLAAFGHRDALALLDGVVGGRRVSSEPACAGRLIELCGGVPLALRAAGGRLAAKPHWTVGHLVNRLEPERGRLAEFGQGGNDLASRVQQSYQALDDRVARMYRQLSFLDAGDFPLRAVGEALRIDLPEAEDLVEHLVDAHLLEVRPGADGALRYRFEELLRLHARYAEPVDDYRHPILPATASADSAGSGAAA